MKVEVEHKKKKLVAANALVASGIDGNILYTYKERGLHLKINKK